MAKTNGGSPFAPARLSQLILDSASQVWHVGIDAYARVGAEGSRLVGSLLTIGGQLDREAKSRVYEARTSAEEAWDRLEYAFAQRVARALNALQIPTARDVHELNRRVEELQQAVVALERRAAEAARVRPRPAARRATGTGARTKPGAPAGLRNKAGR